MSDMIVIDLAAMFSDVEPWLVSNSRANLGESAGEITWRNALAIGGDHESWLKSDLADAVSAMRGWAFETGAWGNEEIEGWSDAECLALLAQNVASDLRDHLDADNVDLAESCALYAATDWEKESSYPTGSFYLNDISRRLDPTAIPILTPMCDWYAGS